MSRFRRAVHGVASSYFSLAAAAVYSLASVPVALHYLDKPRFGLWALMSTLVGYFSLIDAGMSSAAARLIIDYKDHHDRAEYGSFIKTGWLVSSVQGGIVLFIGLAFAPWLATLLSIPDIFRPEFIRLVHWNCGAIALNFSARILGMVLNAHQRMDWVNYSLSSGLVVNFAAQWILFHFGFGVMSLAWASFGGTAAGVFIQWRVCQHYKFLAGGNLGRVSWVYFREIFGFGKDLFLVAIGTQLIMYSQVIIITRMLGLEAAAVWAVGMRVFNLISQLIWKIPDMAYSAFAEMMARNETVRLRERYRSLCMLTFSFAGWMAVCLAVCNTDFITVWTHGKIQWPLVNGCLQGLWTIVLAVNHCHNNLVLATKKVAFMRYIYFLEGAVFVTAACLLSRIGGLPAIIACSIICSACLTTAYGIWRIHRYLQMPVGEIAWGWMRPMCLMLMFLLPPVILVRWLAVPDSEILRFLLNAAVAGAVGLFFFLRLGLPASFQSELLARAPGGVGFLLKRVFAPQTK